MPKETAPDGPAAAPQPPASPEQLVLPEAMQRKIMMFDAIALVHNQAEQLPPALAYTYLNEVYENASKNLSTEALAAYTNYQQERQSAANDGASGQERLQLALAELQLLLSNPNTEPIIHTLEALQQMLSKASLVLALTEENDMGLIGEVMIN